MQLTAKRHQADDFQAVQEYFHSRQWTDGLPVVPPTPEAVAACLDWVVMPPDQLIGVEPVRERPITAEKLAINAVMAGCLPMHFPVVVAAFTAMLKEPFLLHGATASTGGCAVLIVINGPIRDELGMDGTFNALGPSDRATTAIGRSIRLILGNLMEVRPGHIDRSTFGHPGKISYCISEDEANSPWKPLASELGVPEGLSAVTVMAAGSPRQLMNEWTTKPEEILDTFAAEICANMRHYSIWPGNYAIVVPPQLRTHFANAGWSKADIRQYVFEKARIRRAEWADCGKGAIVADKGEQEYAALPSPDHLLVIAAGGPAGGFGAVIPPWLGHKSRAATVAIDACLDCG
ncbi:MAG: hypothetical protein ACI89J_000472 [Hyphomicrobiaceae bacterium]|jgi:hypothetical protein